MSENNKNNGMVSLKIPPTKKEKLYPELSSSSDEYPYGMRLNLEKRELNKLGLDVTTTKVGSKLRLIIECNVNRVSKSGSINSSNGGSESMDLQVISAKVVKEPETQNKNFEHKQIAKPRN